MPTTTTETPAKNFRVARCCGYFAWPGSDPIGCLVCGGGLQTTTRLQRQQPWQILSREEAREASRLAGGLPASIAYQRRVAASRITEAERVEAQVASGERELDANGCAWTMRAPYDFELARGVTGPQRCSGSYPSGLRAAAAKAEAKAERLERKLAKLGGAA
jgi:hypothetical protein